MSKIPVLDASIGDVAVFFRLNKDQAYIDSLALAHQGAARHVTISSAAFGERENRIYLKTAARWTGGKSFLINNPLEAEQTPVPTIAHSRPGELGVHPVRRRARTRIPC